MGSATNIHITIIEIKGFSNPNPKIFVTLQYTNNECGGFAYFVRLGTNITLQNIDNLLQTCTYRSPVV
jgi:hypothetical protein